MSDNLVKQLRNYENPGITMPLAADRIEQLDEAIIAAMEFIDRYVDIVDGPDGIPEPNEAMSLNTYLQKILDGNHD